jgi:hypothetical protein
MRINLAAILFVATIFCVSFGARAMQDEKITASNWQRHPKILQVRAIVNSVDASIKKGSFKVSKREFEYCESYEDTLRRMAVDSKGVVRRYENEAGSDDSALTWRHYYDELGRLRFVFITGGAANGAQLEHRIYLDEDGKRLWEEHKYVKGPGYTWPEVWPEEQNDEARPIQKSEPAKAFAAKSPCEEKKPRYRTR